MDSTQQVPKKLPHQRNPTGVGGFKDHPENQSPGGWKKENTASYQLNRFMNMSANDFEAFTKKSKKDMTMAELLSFHRVLEARKSLPDFKEVVDRTEGKAVQQVELRAEVHSIDDLLS